jgi:nitrous oxidase accessory protein NosD
MKTNQPTNAMVIREDTRFEPGIYLIPDGITLAADGITLDGNGAHLIGQGKPAAAIQLNGISQVTVKNLQISSFHRGIEALDCQELTVKNCRVREAAPHNQPSKSSSPWRAARDISCGIFLAGVRNSEVLTNDLQCQTNGLAAFACHKIRVKGNNLSHQPGFGLILSDTSHAKIEENIANHCGADSGGPLQPTALSTGTAGFLLINGSSDNLITSNQARLCSNGFRAVLSPTKGQGTPCNTNRFENNDASRCVGAGFIDNGNKHNCYINNQVHHATVGFSLQNVTEVKLENNSLLGNLRAGIAAENCAHCDAIHNTLQDNRFGILLWSRPEDPKEPAGQGEMTTSEFWEIHNNTFLRNHTGIRITADQIAGLTPVNPNLAGQLPRPHDHKILQNVFSDNRLGIQTQEVERTIIKDNQFELNLLGDIKS